MVYLLIEWGIIGQPIVVFLDVTMVVRLLDLLMFLLMVDLKLE
jgi:hypothetical protein